MNRILKRFRYDFSIKSVLIVLFSLCFFGFIIVRLDTPKSFIKEVMDINNGYIQEQNFGDLNISVRYQSPDELCVKQILRSKSKNLDHKLIRKDYEHTIDFEMNIKLPPATDELTEVAGSTMIYQELINYFAFGIQEDLVLKTEDREYKSDFIHFERNYGMSPNVILQFGFNKGEELKKEIESGNDIDIRFDADRFNLGPIYFHYSNETITYTPIIIY